MGKKLLLKTQPRVIDHLFKLILIAIVILSYSVTSAAGQNYQVETVAEGLINFNSHVVYLISDEAIKNRNVMTGDYQMQITTKDGSAVEHIPFSIIDTRE